MNDARGVESYSTPPPECHREWEPVYCRNWNRAGMGTSRVNRGVGKRTPLDTIKWSAILRDRRRLCSNGGERVVVHDVLNTVNTVVW